MRIRTSFIIVGICFSSVVFAQAQTAAPSAENGHLPRNAPDLLRQYNFAAQIQALNDLSSLDPSLKSSAVAPQFPNLTKAVSPIEPTPSLPVDVKLSPTALAAVQVSEKWRGETNEPAAGRDGRVLYSFGAGLPTVVCAPLRVCTIELQAGEHIIGEPQIGDSVRWNISPAMYGAGSDATSVIVLKPTCSGLDTNLLIATDRRAYYLRLVSKPEEYVARVAFQYPQDDSARKWQQQMRDQQIGARRAKRDSEVLPAMLAVEKLNFRYRVKGGNEHLRPIRVYDDGAKTYIQMPTDIQHREVPALLVLGADGKGEMTNYRVRQQTYIVDRLFDRAQLVLGSGKKSQKVEIAREPKG